MVAITVLARHSYAPDVAHRMVAQIEEQMAGLVSVGRAFPADTYHHH